MEIDTNNYEIVYVVITYLFILLGIAYMAEGRIPREYIAIICYFIFKMVTLYEKCTLSYIECKLRNVKKEEGYIYDFLHSIIILRETPHAKHFYLIGTIFIIYYLTQG